MTSALLLGLDTAGVISLLLGTVLPLLVGLLTSRSLNPGVKAALLAALSGLASVLTQWLAALNSGQHFAWQQVVVSAFLTWAVGELSYLKLWRPSGAAARLADLGVRDRVAPDATPAAGDYGDSDATYTGSDVVLPGHTEADLAGVWRTPPVEVPAPVEMGTAAAVQVAREQAGVQD